MRLTSYLPQSGTYNFISDEFLFENGSCWFAAVKDMTIVETA